MDNLSNYLKIIILTLLFISCEESTEIEPIKGLIADAGEDITIPASSYVVFDASGSYLGENPNINNLCLEWIQNENNPEEVSLFSGDNLTRVVGFIKEGTYTFKLVINNGTDTSNTDEKVVTVLPREKSIIEDPYLEIHIRYQIKKQKGEVTNEDLIRIDTLGTYKVPLGFRNIISLKGIENCINAEKIQFNLESISDLSPLKNLKGLKFLSILSKLNNFRCISSSKFDELRILGFRNKYNLRY